MWWDYDVTEDRDGDTDPANDFEGFGCNAANSYPGPGTYTAQVTATNSNQCTAVATVEVEVLPTTPPPGELLLLLDRPQPGTLRADWTALPEAATYRIARGTRVVPLDRCATEHQDAGRGGRG